MYLPDDAVELAFRTWKPECRVIAFPSHRAPYATLPGPVLRVEAGGVIPGKKGRRSTD